jgi:benzylsuccinate CoA-transferase BbsE subunit
MAADRAAAPAATRERPLASTRVLDLSGPFGAYAGRLLSDLGADVIRVVPPTGDPLADDPPVVATSTGPASAFQWFVNLGKQVVELDLARPGERELCEQLFASADVLLETWGPDPVEVGGWERADVEARFPGLVMVSITPFGLDGPRGRDAGTDLVTLASGGLLALGGYPDTSPIAPTGGQAMLAASIFGAVAAIFGLIARQADGRGRRLDVSAEEAVASALEDAIPQYDLTGRVRRRAGDVPREAGTGIFRCADGYVSMVAGRLGTAKAWRSLVEWLVEERAPGAEVLLGDDWQSFPFRQRPEAVAQFAQVFGPFAAGRTKAQLYEEAQRRSIALAPVNEIPDVLDNPQLAARDFFVPVHVPELGRAIQFPGRPYRLSDDPPFRPRVSAGPGPAAAALLPESAPPRPADVPALSRPTTG